MNNKIKPEEFFNSFAEGKVEKSSSKSLLKKTLTAMTVVAAVALTGCANSGAIYNDVAANNKVLVAEGKAPVEIKKFDFNTYQDVINNKKSGVYQNPYGNSSVTSIKFISDKEGTEKIKKDLENLGLDLSVPELDNKSNVHRISPFGLKGDVGLSLITDLKGSDILPIDYAMTHPEMTKYEEYFVVMHEIAHGFSNQRIGVFKGIESLFSKDYQISMENGSDYSAAIKTIQLMHNDGVEQEEILEFMERIASVRMHGTSFKGGVSTHLSGPELRSLLDIYKNDPDRIYNMTGPQIEKSSGLVVEALLESNFRDAIENGIRKDLNDFADIKYSLSQMKYDLQEDNPNIQEIVRNFIEDSDSMHEIELRQKISEVVVNYPDEIIFNSDNFQSIIDNAIDRTLYEKEVMLITEEDSQMLLGKYDTQSFPDLTMEISNKMNEVGAFSTPNAKDFELSREKEEAPELSAS